MDMDMDARPSNTVRRGTCSDQTHRTDSRIGTTVRAPPPAAAQCSASSLCTMRSRPERPHIKTTATAHALQPVSSVRTVLTQLNRWRFASSILKGPLGTIPNQAKGLEIKPALPTVVLLGTPSKGVRWSSGARRACGEQ